MHAFVGKLVHYRIESNCSDAIVIGAKDGIVDLTVVHTNPDHNQKIGILHSSKLLNDSWHALEECKE